LGQANAAWPFFLASLKKLEEESMKHWTCLPGSTNITAW